MVAKKLIVAEYGFQFKNFRLFGIFEDLVVRFLLRFLFNF